MSGYSYSEIQNMQQKAMARVREMKRTSDEITKVAQKELDYQYEKTEPSSYKPTITAKVTNMPPNFPKEDIYDGIVNLANSAKKLADMFEEA